MLQNLYSKLDKCGEMCNINKEKQSTNAVK